MKTVLCMRFCAVMAFSAFVSSLALAEGIEAETNLPIYIANKKMVDVVSDGINVAGSVKIGENKTFCSEDNEGSLRFDKTKKVFEGCDGSKWGPLFKTTGLNFVTETEYLCERGGNYTVIANCPAGSELLNCAGGPGDQMEDYEYWVLMPDYQNNRCIGYSGQPACFDAGWSQTIVMAVCYNGYK